MIFLSSFGVLGLFVVSWEALVGRAQEGEYIRMYLWGFKPDRLWLFFCWFGCLGSTSSLKLKLFLLYMGWNTPSTPSNLFFIHCR